MSISKQQQQNKKESERMQLRIDIIFSVNSIDIFNFVYLSKKKTEMLAANNVLKIKLSFYRKIFQ